LEVAGDIPVTVDTPTTGILGTAILVIPIRAIVIPMIAFPEIGTLTTDATLTTRPGSLAIGVILMIETGILVTGDTRTIATLIQLGVAVRRSA
jgi:hypothetical protein